MLIIDWLFITFTYANWPVNKKSLSMDTSTSKLKKQFFVVLMIVGFWYERNQKTIIIKAIGRLLRLWKKIWRRWREPLISIVFALIFVGVFYILPTFPFFLTENDTSGDMGKMLVSAMISLLITTTIIVNGKEKQQKLRCIAILFTLFVIVCILVCKGILNIGNI